MDNKPFTFDRVVRIIIFIAVFIGLVWLLSYLSDVLIPFAVALLLTVALLPYLAVLLLLGLRLLVTLLFALLVFAQVRRLRRALECERSAHRYGTEPPAAPRRPHLGL